MTAVTSRVMKDVHIHPTAIVETQDIGPGTRIWAFTHVMKGVSIGAHCNIGEHCFIESGAIAGDNVTVKNGNQLWDGVSLSDGVFVGPNVTFTNDLRPRSPRLPQAAKRYGNHGWLSPIVVKTGASVGAGAIILAGNTVGEFAMVGAGAIVTRDVAAYTLVVGAPAKVVGWVCQCGSRIEFQRGVAACEDCARVFLQHAGAVILNSQRTASV
jgi:UDP-2-acetamido-3-amino-2,3-dideoxy-glucuronate N-acetyltransferase